MRLIKMGLRMAVCGVAAVAGFAHAQLFSDPAARDWQELEVSPPAAPADADLRAFFVSSASPNRFFIDSRSLQVGEDGVVRYVLVVRTPGGAQNITFEGIRCASGERRIYASGRSDGSWAQARNSAWEPIADNAYNRPRAALAFDYFCDGAAAPRSTADALRRMNERDGAAIKP